MKRLSLTKIIEVGGDALWQHSDFQNMVIGKVVL